MAMSVSIVFTPTIAGGAVNVTGATFSEVKDKVVLELQNRLSAAQTGVNNLQTALSSVNS